MRGERECCVPRQTRSVFFFCVLKVLIKLHDVRALAGWDTSADAVERCYTLLKLSRESAASSLSHPAPRCFSIFESFFLHVRVVAFRLFCNFLPSLLFLFTFFLLTFLSHCFFFYFSFFFFCSFPFEMLIFSSCFLFDVFLSIELPFQVPFTFASFVFLLLPLSFSVDVYFSIYHT